MGRLFNLLAVAVTIGLAISLFSNSVLASGDAYGLHADWLANFMEAVKSAAQNSPKWPAQHQRIQRYLHEIESHLHGMVKAAQGSDRAIAEQEASQVIMLLRRGFDKGYLKPDDMENLISLIKKYLPV